MKVQVSVLELLMYGPPDESEHSKRGHERTQLLTSWHLGAESESANQG